ncbi:inactive histone-lysine N-methyltransferase 2E isoform X2 [Ischnura elegans]|uniref:inactive histone-lysine N-methyltransferase 2E isoform X2 n=1 Tax=Ischnura elegans TaxID=197161 RepID=UPI001ED89FB1|nr:inactive histone-lysine N-methyltransferase 2E isoform X2 [Ischnura elegans]
MVSRRGGATAAAAASAASPSVTAARLGAPGGGRMSLIVQLGAVVATALEEVGGTSQPDAVVEVSTGLGNASSSAEKECAYRKSKSNSKYPGACGLPYQFVLQDHNYGAPPPPTPPMSPTTSRQSDQDGVSGSNRMLSSLPSEVAAGGGGVRLEDDEDSRGSGLSSPRRVDGEQEEGEETETAPEGEEDEDDSVTRCICNFEHDDGYMICCDKCFVWQHVDCMGIDRSNIPDEYQCERCQPRRVDRTRARALQLRKREELSHHHSDSSSSSTSSSSRSPVPPRPPPYSISNGPSSGDNAEESGRRRRRTSASSSGLLAAARNKAESKRGAMKRKKQESVREQVTNSGLGGAAANASMGKESSNSSRSIANQRPLRRRKRRDSIKGAEYKRATAKRRGKAAAKSLGADEVMGDEETQDSWEVGTSSGAGAVQLRRWIDNYEEAVTNHYSPELRARLSAIRVNGIHSGLNSGVNGLGSLNISSHHSSASKCRVTQLEPGLRALVASSYLHSNQIVIEIRGKYMLGTQHRQQSSIAKRYPPFLFFYELPKDGTEVCVDARTYGNAARFIRRSCRPNAEVRHCIEKGVLHLYIVTTSSIEKNAEITILHESHHQQLDAHGHLICACNSKDCTAPAPYKRNGIMETERDRRRRGRRTISSEGDNPEPPVSAVATTQSSAQHSMARKGPKSPTKVPAATAAAASTPIPSSFSSSSSFSAAAASVTVAVASPSPLPAVPPPQNVQEDSSDATRMDSDQAEASNKKKLTREERKMEAIMKAFERLEKAEQRRQEVLARQAQRKEQDVVADGSSRSVRKEEDAVAAAVAAAAAAVASKRAVEDDEEEDEKADGLEMRSERPRRKGRKGRGRLSAPQRRNSRIQSGDGESDLTSADEGPAFPPASSATSSEPLSSSSTIASISTSVPSIPPPCPSPTSPLTSWPGESASSPSTNPQVPISSLPYGSQCPINNIAFAGPLTPGFKFPKTKKVLMNEWLNKGPSESVPASGASLATAQSSLPSGGKGEVGSFSHSPVVGLSPSALLPLSAGRESLACALVAAAIGTPLSSVSPGSVASADTTGVGSAKKRWLRQAIRDETDSPAGNICCSPNSRAGSPPCTAGDYVTPLKKRRLARESMSSEQSFTPPTTPLGGCENDGGNNSSSPPPTSKAIAVSEKPAHGDSGGALDEEEYEEEEEEYEEEYAEEYEGGEEDEEEETVGASSPPPPVPSASEEVVSGGGGKDDSEAALTSAVKVEEGGEEEEGDEGDGGGRRRQGEERSSANGGIGVCCPKGSDQDFVGGYRKNGISHKEMGFQDMKESTSQPATKRKLSISEYRKRKLRASGDEKPDSIKIEKEGASPPLAHSGGEVDHISIKEEGKLASSILEGLESDRKGCDEKSTELCYTRWNSAPTLVERQRENLTERLKREFGLCVGDEEEQERLRKHLGIAEVVDKALGKETGGEAKLSSRMLVVHTLATAPPPPPPPPNPPHLPPPPPPQTPSSPPPPPTAPSLLVPAVIGRPPIPLLKAVPAINTIPPPVVPPAAAYAINGGVGGPVASYGYPAAAAAAAALPPVSLPPPPPPPPLPPPVQYPPLVPTLPFVPPANSSIPAMAGRPSRAPGQATAHPVASPIMAVPSVGSNNATGNIVVAPSVCTTSKTFFGQGFLPSRT